jgi:hypothetical protein
MRKFSVSLNLPDSCECCGQKLPTHENNVSVGLPYRIELFEGDMPTKAQLGDGFRVILSRGSLVVEIRQQPSGYRAWQLARHYNPDAFKLAKHETRDETVDGVNFLWHTFTFTLLEFKPWYSTWHAELRFQEVKPFEFDAHVQRPSASNAGQFSVRIETLE